MAIWSPLALLHVSKLAYWHVSTFFSSSVFFFKSIFFEGKSYAYSPKSCSWQYRLGATSCAIVWILFIYKYGSHLLTSLCSSGYNSSSILGELPRNGKTGRCNTCHSSNTYLWKFSPRSKASWVQTHWKVKIADSMFSIQPNRISLLQETAWRDCSDCSKAPQASGKNGWIWTSTVRSALEHAKLSWHYLKFLFSVIFRFCLMKYMNILFMHQQLIQALQLCQACGRGLWQSMGFLRLVIFIQVFPCDIDFIFSFLDSFYFQSFI